MSTVASPLMTASQFVQQFGNQRAELVHGKVMELAMPGTQHGIVCMRTALAIGSFVEKNQLGRAAGNDTFVQTHRGPDSVRGADICYWSFNRFPPGPVPQGLADAPPELVVEVRSPSDRWKQMVAKAIEYLDAGVDVVVLLDPNSSTATVFRPDEIQQVFDNGDMLTIPDVLPGFSVPVKQLFA